MAEGRGAWRRRARAWVATVRVRTTVVAVLVVAVALAAGAVALVTVLRDSLGNGVLTAASDEADEIVAGLASAAPGLELKGGERDEAFVQILDPATGAVIAASANVAGRPALVALRPGASVRVRTDLNPDGWFLAVAADARTPVAARTVVVGRALDDVDEAVGDVVGALAAGLPALLAVVALTTWYVVGRALRPVEAIRAEVDEISGAQLHRRVPQPPGADEVARLAATMNRMLGRLEESQQRQRRFASDASHELRSPVASIRQHAEVARAHPERTTVSALAETVLAENVRVQDMVEDLLVLATADEAGLALGRAPVDLDELIFAQVQHLRAGTGTRIDTAAVSGGRVLGDASRLERVVRNLLDNAVRHARGLVAVGLRERDGVVVLWVADDGPGVPPDRRAQVFERFVRLDGARGRRSGGSGLGLAIVAEIVAAHDGTVAVGARPGGGSCFEVRLRALPDWPPTVTSPDLNPT